LIKKTFIGSSMVEHAAVDRQLPWETKVEKSSEFSGTCEVATLSQALLLRKVQRLIALGT